MWVTQNLEDVKSDMSAFHRVDDITTMSAASFFPRVERLVAYKGVVQMRARLDALREEQRRTPSQQVAPRSGKNVVPESVMLSEHERDGWAERG